MLQQCGKRLTNLLQNDAGVPESSRSQSHATHSRCTPASGQMRGRRCRVRNADISKCRPALPYLHPDISASACLYLLRYIFVSLEIHFCISRDTEMQICRCRKKEAGVQRIISLHALHSYISVTMKAHRRSSCTVKWRISGASQTMRTPWVMLSRRSNTFFRATATTSM